MQCEKLFFCSLETYSILANDKHNIVRRLIYVFASILFIPNAYSQCYVHTAATNALCHGACDGTAFIDSISGAAPFTYLWASGNETTSSISGLCIGTYTLTITDDTGCVATCTVSVFQPSPLGLFTASNPNNSCLSCNGAAFAIASGGSPPYSYLWNTSQSGSSISSLCPGEYRVTATDSHGCQKTDSTNVAPPSPPNVSTSGTPASCFNCADGSADANPSGGNAPYSYSWSNGQTVQNVTGLLPASYSVCIIDANGCTSCDSITISFTTGIAGINDNALLVFPDPAINFIFVEGITSEYNYEIMNSLGDVLQKGSGNADQQRIELSGFSEGIYFLRISSSKGTSIKRLIRQ